ncbi:MAG TPA: ATP-binding protein [Verrucomicrobiae bacterium]|nr:ATP-binding protein [Verrucomicrobiae bacterium]
MRLSLKTKLTLAISLLVLAVVATVSTLYLARLTRQVLRQASDRAQFVAQQLFLACQEALGEAAERGDAPASDSQADLRAYVQRAFDNSSPLNSVMESAVGYSPTIYEVTITDQDGVVLVSSDATLRDQKIPVRPKVTSLVRSDFFRELQSLYGPQQTYEYTYPFNLGAGPFGDIRIGLSSALIRDEITPALKTAAFWALGSVLLSTLLVFLVTTFSLSPIERISKQLDRISAGEFDFEPVHRGDELGQVSTKIVGIGKQLREVREVFSSLRENLDQVMSGLADGMLLFNSAGRAVLVSPSVERFIGGRPEELAGRRVSEIFPPGHAVREAIKIVDEEIAPVDKAEAILEGRDGSRRVELTVQAIREHGARMGTLMTLRDVESIEEIGTQLEVSERLAALGRVTAGVAHEVKNPLNSMRLWLEVLKGNMPVAPEPQQAVKMLDSEIDRLDRAVKTFLNFTRPVELKLEETNLAALLEEVLEAAHPSIRKAGVELRVDIPENFPPVRADRQLLHQAVLNLLLNASEFTPEGGRISLSLRRTGEFAVVAVSDTGQGISPEDQKKIFQLFFTTRPGGTGIGLANSFRFVQLQNGRIEFDSEVGRGTTFRVQLPLLQSGDLAAGRMRDSGQPIAEKSP